MTIKASQKPSLQSDPLKISASKSPHLYSHSTPQPDKMQGELVSSSPRPYPVSIRAYTQKDYNYIASFSRVTRVGMNPKSSNAKLLQCHELQKRRADDVRMAAKVHPSKQSHASLPEFGAWNAETSSPVVKGYTDVFDRAREERKGGSLPARLHPPNSKSPVIDLAKEVAVAKLPLQVSTHHRKRSSLERWSRCFVAPVTTE